MKIDASVQPGGNKRRRRHPVPGRMKANEAPVLDFSYKGPITVRFIRQDGTVEKIVKEGEVTR